MPIHDQKQDGNAQAPDDREIETAPCQATTTRRFRNIIGTLYAFRCQVVDPGEYERYRKTEPEHDEDRTQD